MAAPLRRTVLFLAVFCLLVLIAGTINLFTSGVVVYIRTLDTEYSPHELFMIKLRAASFPLALGAFFGLLSTLLAIWLLRRYQEATGKKSGSREKNKSQADGAQKGSDGEHHDL